MKRLTLLIILSLLTLSINSFSQEKKEISKKQIKPALLVIDTQNAYMGIVPEQEKGISFYFINSLIELFRKNGYPIIRVYHHDVVSGPHPGDEAFEYPSAIKVEKNDRMVVKTYPDAFNKTELDKVLKETGSNTLFLTGFSAVGCVISTYVGAMNHDYNVHMVKYAIMSHDAAYTDNIEIMFDAVGWEVVKQMVESAD